MHNLTELPATELHALSRLVDEFQHAGDDVDPRPQWRALLQGEVRRRMDQLLENQRILEAARAARDVTASG